MRLGTIALDIDGTITDRSHLIPDRVVSFFETLYKEGWAFIFVTGRSFSFAMRTLPKLSFPYFLGLQNGADLLKMPEKEEVGRCYLSLEVIEKLDALYKDEEGDFLIYSGYERGDICYFRPKHFSAEMQRYLKGIEKFSDAPWEALESFNNLEQKSFPLIKYLGSKESMERLNHTLKKWGGIQTTLIKDPLSDHLYLILVTHAEANKGIAVQRLVRTFDLQRPVIAGGDDNNDISLLEQGDLRIAMEGAPQKLLDLADFIAPPGDKEGIIEGITHVLEKLP